jgi:ribose transport system ATP-binding protein
VAESVPNPAEVEGTPASRSADFSAPAGAGPALQITDLEKSYGSVHALSSAHMSAYAGEVHALLGENGAGKSTLIKILAGAERADSGSILLDGHEFHPRSTAAAEKAGVSTVFQELSLVPDMSVSENMLFGREPLTGLRTIRRGQMAATSRELLERYGVTGINPRAKAGALSVAERQQVEIVKALSRDPHVLILDEATSALSSDEQRWVLDLAAGLAAEGRVVLFISHRMQEIRKLAARMTILQGGKTVAETGANDLDDDEIMQLMLGRRVDRLFPPKGQSGTEVAMEVRNLLLPGRRQPINFKHYEGEILGVGGLQGQGQRELLRALAGVGHYEGEVLVEGRPQRLRSAHAALRAGIAFVPEDRKGEGLLLQRPIQENISLPVIDRVRNGMFLSRRKEDEVVQEAVSRLSLSKGSLERPASNLSGGNQQKVVLAKLLVAQPRILLLYDATRGVDVGTKADIFDLLVRLAADGRSILFYSTDLQELARVCHRVLVMSGGEVVGEVSGDLTEEAILRVAFGAGEARQSEAVQS